MKKLIVMLAFVVAGASAANAQTTPVLPKGGMVGQVGLNAIGNAGIGINASLEYGLNDALFGQEWLGWGVGGSIDTWFGDAVIIVPAARTALHLQLPVKGLDIYLGVGLGLYTGLTDPIVLEFDWNTFTGVRYFFTESIGAYFETGVRYGGFGGGTLGISFRF